MTEEGGITWQEEWGTACQEEWGTAWQEEGDHLARGEGDRLAEGARDHWAGCVVDDLEEGASVRLAEGGLHSTRHSQSRNAYAYAYMWKQPRCERRFLERLPHRAAARLLVEA